jgi:hypothetical protein
MGDSIIINKLRVFEKKVLRAMFSPGRDETLGQWRKLHNYGLENHSK